MASYAMASIGLFVATQSISRFCSRYDNPTNIIERIRDRCFRMYEGLRNRVGANNYDTIRNTIVPIIIVAPLFIGFMVYEIAIDLAIKRIFEETVRLMFGIFLTTIPL